MNDHCHTIVNGIVGTTCSFLGVLTTFQQELEWGIRVTGGCIGIIIGVITLYNLVKPKKP